MIKWRNSILLASALLIVLGAVAVSSSPVVAQPSCVAQLSYPVTATEYSPSYAPYYASWNIQLNVPISTTCNYSAGQLHAVGSAYDTVTNAYVAYANTPMNPVNGYAGGDLVFNLPPSALGHLLQMTVTVYNGAYAYGYSNYGVVAWLTFTATIHPSYYYNGYYPYGYSNYYYGYYPTYYMGKCYNSRDASVYYYNGYYHFYGTCYFDKN